LPVSARDEGSAWEEAWRWSGHGREGENPGGLKSQERIGSSRAANPRRPDERTSGQVQTPEGAFGPSATERVFSFEALRNFVRRAGSGRSRNGLGPRVFRKRRSRPSGHGLAQRKSRRRQRRQEGKAGREALPTSQEGKPLKGEPHERHRYETRPDGFGRSKASRHCESAKALHNRVVEHPV